MSEPEGHDPEGHDPVRGPAREDPSSGLGRLFDAARRDPGLDARALERVAERAAEPPAPPPPWGSIAALATIGLALLGVVAWNARYEAPSPPTPAPSTVDVAVSVAPVAPVEVAPAEVAPAIEAPPSEPSVRRPRVERAEAPLEVVEEAPAAGPTEGALLLRARAALRSDPARALALAEEHRSAFPEGTMAAEREVIAIEALASLARFDAARTRAARFTSSYPASPYRGRVEAALARESSASP